MEKKSIMLPGKIEMAGRFAHTFGQLQLLNEKAFYDVLFDNAGKEVSDREIVLIITTAMIRRVGRSPYSLFQHIDALVGESQISHPEVLSAKQHLENIAKRMAN